MKNETLKHNWLIDAVLFVAFILTFFLDWTGVQLHQWLGMAAGALALYHLARHWDWVVAVGQRLSERLQSRSAGYFLIDAGLMFGFVSILASGLLISTWFDLAWIDLDVVWTYHVIFSVLTLALLLLKIGLHGRWIVKVAREKVFAPPSREKALATKAGSPIDRREFLKLMGAVGVVSLVALGKGLGSLAETQGSQASVAGDPLAEATATQAPTATATSTSVASSTSTSAPTATAQVVSPTATPESSASAAQTCTIRCNRGCSYPGHCRRYTDANNNGKCDQSECA